MNFFFLPEYISIAMMAVIITRDCCHGVNWGSFTNRAPKLQLIWNRK
jgi:hypothetical protein